MKNDIPNGVWPTMITPFTDSNEIDYVALEEMIEWYIKNQVDGLFAACQSSEIFYLSKEERTELVKFVKEKAGNRIPIIASGHVSDSMEDQTDELKAIAATGVDAVVLITNRLALQEESDDVWKSNLEKLLKEIPEHTPMGFYECPLPYKRLISPELLEWCASTGRFLFLKDTSCDLDDMRAKLQAVKGSELKIFNANAATLLESLRDGVSGYSGVMANMHPGLYIWLTRNWYKEPEKAKELMDFLGLASVIERQLYPVTAKYYMQLEGINITLNSRTRDCKELAPSFKLEIEQLYNLSKKYSQTYKI